jgi:hypothetical protein
MVAIDKKCLTILLLFSFVLPPAVTSTHAQAVLNGFVTDATTGEALPGANIVLSQANEIVYGTATDPSGSFVLPGIEPERYELRVTFVGYETYRDSLSFTSGATRTANIELTPSDAELDEVVVQEEGTAGSARITAGHQEIRPEDLQRVPTPDLSGDLASYLSAQPGIVAIGDRGGQLFIRGGEPSQNRIYLDGMPVYQPMHVLGFYSTFPQDIIRNADIYAGGYSSEYNGGLSSIIDVNTRVGNKKRITGSAAVSPFMSSLQIEGPTHLYDFSLLGSFRTSTLDYGASRYVDQELPFAFSDGFAKLHGSISEASRLALSFLQTYDRGQIGQTSEMGSASEVRWQNRAFGARYLILPTFVPVRATIHLSRSYLNTELGPPDNPTRSSSIRTTRIGIMATFLPDWGSFDAGFTGDFTRPESHLGGFYQNLEEEHAADVTQTALYLAPEFNLSNGLHIQPGLRAQFYRVRFDPYVEPYLRANWDLGAHHLSASAGLYHQELIGLSDRRDAANVFTAWTNIPPEDPASFGQQDIPFGRPNRVRSDVRTGRIGRAIHTTAGYRVRPTPWFEAAVEGYYRKLRNLFISEWTAYPRFTTRLQPATGRSYGFETRVELQRGPFFGYINYGLSYTRYQARQASLELWYGQEAMDFRPPHDRRHQVNVLTSLDLLGFTVNARWTYGSGRPFSPAVGFDGFRLIDDVENVMNVPGSRRVIYEEPYSGELPPYHRLDLSISRSFAVRRADVTFQGTLINAYNRTNIFYLDVFTLERSNQLPMVPSLSLKVEI